MANLRERLAAKAQAETTQSRYVPADDAGGALEVEVAVDELRPHAKGTMLAFLDVTATIGAAKLRLNDCVLHEKQGETWVNLPSKQYKKRDGTTGYAPLILLDEGTHRAFQRAAIEAVERTEAADR